MYTFKQTNLTVCVHFISDGVRNTLKLQIENIDRFFFLEIKNIFYVLQKLNLFLISRYW